MRIGALVAPRIALAIVACSSKEEGPTPTPSPPATTALAAESPALPDATESADAPPANEDELAASYLLTIDDMPIGWSAMAAEESSGALDRCALMSEGRTGSADSDRFESGRTSTLDHSVAVYVSEDAAIAAAERFGEFVDCIVDEINNGALDTDDVRASDARAGRVSMPGAVAYRISAKAVPAGGGVSLEVHLDLVLQQSGRVVSFLVATDIVTPFEPSLLSELVATVAQTPIVGARPRFRSRQNGRPTGGRPFVAFAGTRYATAAFACSASLANASGRVTARSASAFRSSSMPAARRPWIRRL